MAAIRGCNSVVECHLPMVNVVGSSPIARFNLHLQISVVFRKLVLIRLFFRVNLSDFCSLGFNTLN